MLYKSKKMLITGASGFIGKAFLKNALNTGWHIRVLTRKPNDWPLQVGLEVVEGDFASTKDWGNIVHNVQVVVNCAAEINATAFMHLVNVQGPRLLLQAALNAGVKRWVQLSSVGAYGYIQEGVVTENWPDNPTGQYELSKTEFDDLLKLTAQCQDIEICILRPSNVFGPGMRNQSVVQMTRAIRKGLFAYIGSAGASANYVHVDDVVQALQLCVEKPQAANKTYIVSDCATMEDVANGLAIGLGVPFPSKRLPLKFARWLALIFKWLPSWPLTMSRVNAMSLCSCYSTKKIEAELGWAVKVPVKEGMSQFAQNIQS